MDTPRYLNELISYKEVYGTDGTENEAQRLIADLTSASVIYKLAAINIHFYLSTPGNNSKSLQVKNLSYFLQNSSPDFVQRMLREFNRVEAAKNWPAIFWGHSTLLFYDLIFRNYVPGLPRKLSRQHIENILKAYLIINSETNNRFTLTKEGIEDAVSRNALEEVFLPHFIYQRDYASNLDFANQVNRGVLFFQYLERSSEYQSYVQLYYQTMNVKDYKDLLYNLLTVWTQAEIHGPADDRRSQISFSTVQEFVNLPFIDTLAINNELANYHSDSSFKLIREHPLFRIGPSEYIILDINFLIDHLYKAQVFAFSKHLSANGYKGNFLSVKGKDFMEDIYLRQVMSRCFPTDVNLNGDDVRLVNGEELCDYYTRRNHKLLLIEFKDVLLNADVKTGAIKEEIDKELDKKFSANQAGKPKGITQLFNAINYLDTKDLTKDSLDRSLTTEVFPVIVYTDISFGQDGINKRFSAKFDTLLKSVKLQHLHINGVTFINLNYFEVHELYLKNNMIDVFDLIKGYQRYVKTDGHSLTPFETFSRGYFEEHDLPDMKENLLLKQNLKLIMSQAPQDAFEKE